MSITQTVHKPDTLEQLPPERLDRSRGETDELVLLEQIV